MRVPVLMRALDSAALSSRIVDLVIGAPADVVNLVHAKIFKNVFRNKLPLRFTRRREQWAPVTFDASDPG
jgi:hypothetical protein